MASDQQPLHQKDKNAHHQPDNRPPKGRTCTGYCCYKFLVVIYSIFFFIIGILLLGIGIWVISVKQQYESINDFITSPCILALIVGGAMVLTSIFGVFGALREKLVLLRIFLAIVIIAFIIQVVIGILAFVFREETIKVANSQLESGIKYYHENDDVQKAVDFFQSKFDCCGIMDGPVDWNLNEDYKCGGSGNFSCTIPDSCCRKPKEGCGRMGRGRAVAFQNGCTWEFLHWVEHHLDVTGATALGFALLHIFGIFLVYMFITKVEDRKLLFKYRKRFYDTSS